MCFLYAKRFSYNAAADPLTASLRTELFAGREYSAIDWYGHRYSIADTDNYNPIHWLMRLVQSACFVYEWLGGCAWLRQWSLRFVEEYMLAEDRESNYLTIAPISKAFHMVCAWIIQGGELDAAAANGSPEVKRHLARVPAYLWVAEDGMKAQGYNGSMAWDTAFAIQAAAEGDLMKEFQGMCSKAFDWFAREQVRALPHGDWRHWRQAIRGGWGFSTAEQAWPVSDTTAEALKAVLVLRKEYILQGKDPSAVMPNEHLFDSVQFLLSYQNGDGGWATYENCRGWKWYELLNPVESFGDIMIDYSYVECSSSAMSALSELSKQFPGHRSKEIEQAISRGAKFIKAMQRDDGSWYGCWGSCFVYGCWFGIEGLVVAGESTSCKEIRSCVCFLLSKQNADGGWGEDFSSCFNRAYESRPRLYGSTTGSTVVQTAWALLAIMAADCTEDAAAVHRGIEFLMRRQEPSGDFPQENIAGVFNRSIGITYTAFRNVFPLWALGRYAQSYALRHGGQNKKRRTA
jgi:squalene/oxidosqualene cyclase-like protein